MASNRGGRRPAGRGRVAGARKRSVVGPPVGAQDESSDESSVDDSTGNGVVSPQDASTDVDSAAVDGEDTAQTRAADGMTASITDDAVVQDLDNSEDLDDDDLDDDDDDDADLDDDDVELEVEDLDDDLEDADLDDDDDDDDDDDADLDDDDDDDDDDDELTDEADDLEDEDDAEEQDDQPVAAPLSGRRARAAAERAAAEKQAPPNKKDATKPGTKPGRKTESASTKKAGSAKTTKAAVSMGGRRSLMRFLREVIAELGKVVWPGRRELIVYTSVVIVFMIFMVSLVAGLDILFAQGVLAVFG